MEQHFTDYKGRPFPGTFKVPDYDPEDGYPVTTWQEPQQDHTQYESWTWDDLCNGDAYKDHLRYGEWISGTNRE